MLETVVPVRIRCVDAFLQTCLATDSPVQTAAWKEVTLLALSQHPEAMCRAQAELDKVVGKDRLPSFADQANLPYVTAVAKEALRWRTVSALGEHI